MTDHATFMADHDMRDAEVVDQKDFKLNLIDNESNTIDIPALIKEISKASDGGQQELNVTLLSKVVDTDPGQVMFCQVLDSLIVNMSNKQTSLFKKQKATKKKTLQRELTYSLKPEESNVTYNFQYRETILLQTKNRSNLKLDLVKTSLLAVYTEDNEDELKNLKSLLDASLPPYAALNLIIFCLNENGKQDKKSLFSDLVNSKKIGNILYCPLYIPDLSREALKLTKLTRRQFSKLLVKHIAPDFNKALETSPLSRVNGTFSYKKVSLDKIVEVKLQNFWRIFGYVANQAPSCMHFESEFANHVISTSPGRKFNDFEFRNPL